MYKWLLFAQISLLQSYGSVWHNIEQTSCGRWGSITDIKIWYDKSLDAFFKKVEGGAFAKPLFKRKQTKMDQSEEQQWHISFQVEMMNLINSSDTQQFCNT